jgi:hypothetical protein
MKMRVAAFALVFFCAPAALAVEKMQVKYAELLDRGRDRVTRSAFVPDEEQPQGEVRLIRRGGAAVMQTVLYSNFLKRVVAEIRKKELSSWPPDREGHKDSLKYIDAVLKTQSRIEDRFRERRNRLDRRRKMLIEFILSDNASIVALSEPELEEKSGRMRIVSARPMVLLELPRGYVRGNFYEIAVDALKLSPKEAKALLDPLLPGETDESARPSKKEGK